MSKKSKQTTKVPAAPSRRIGWWIAGILLIAGIAGYWTWGHYAEAGLDASNLIGQWLRPDGGYVLELSSAEPDGTLKAAYFNPRPINVGHAMWKHQDELLQVFVELRDANYPGSTYRLIYDPATDRLSGMYFQAVEQRQFNVFFERKK